MSLSGCPGEIRVRPRVHGPHPRKAPSQTALAADAVLLADATAVLAERALAPDAVMLASLRAPAFLAPALTALVGAYPRAAVYTDSRRALRSQSVSRSPSASDTVTLTRCVHRTSHGHNLRGKFENGHRERRRSGASGAGVRKPRQHRAWRTHAIVACPALAARRRRCLHARALACRALHAPVRTVVGEET